MMTGVNAVQETSLYNLFTFTINGRNQMPELQLSDAETTALRDLLARALGDLSVEIADTDLKSFRDDLKEKRDHLKAIHDRLS